MKDAYEFLDTVFQEVIDFSRSKIKTEDQKKL